MLSLRAHSNAQAVLSYYTMLPDYYVQSEGGAQWAGLGAERLGLSGAVVRDDFEALLRGQLPDGTQLGTVRDGQLEHRPSWDLTFSAPKSVSVLALVGGDERLIAAHDEAVRAALGYVESQVAQTRIREYGVVRHEAAGNLAIASLREDTSRGGDPQLHTHNVVLNATQTADGQWRSLDGYRFFEAQKEVGQLYRNELALRAQALGYAVLRGRDGTFELAGVPQAVLDAFSSRSAAIEQALAEQGLTRETATSAQKSVATIQTREGKREQTAEDLRLPWQQQAAALGFDARAAVQHTPAAEAATPGRNETAATLAVASAAAKLSERDSVFAERALRLAAMEAAVGTARFDDIERAMVAARERGDLIPRTLQRDGRELAGYTTRAGIDTETRMLAAELSGRGREAPLLSEEAAHRAVARAELSGGFTWTPGQRQTTAAILSGRDQVEALQGYAGTAKTTTVVRTVAEVAARQGYAVIALAPTASAAETLGEATKLPAQTVSRYLGGLDRQDGSARALWIVDEASLLSARQTGQLLDAAKDQGARVLLIGDVQQLGSVEAGAAFRQLQQAGMRTHVLDEIVRQTNEGARDAVYAAIRGEAKAALAAIERSGGVVREVADADARQRAIAQDYAALTPEQRSKTLLLDASRDGREQLTQAVRELLKQDGTLHGPVLRVETLEDKRLTREDAKQVHQYEAGDSVRFRRSYAGGVEKGVYYRVAGTDPQAGTVTLRGKQGQRIDWQPGRWGSGQVEAYAAAVREIAAGDRIAWTRNDRERNRVNGHTAQVIGVRADGLVKVRDGRGTHTLDLGNAGNRHFRHAYVATVHAAQGQTADRVMVNAESFRTNLLNAKSFYVSISRARSEIRLYTDDRKELIRGIEERSGEKAAALHPEAATARPGERQAREHTPAAERTQRDKSAEHAL